MPTLLNLLNHGLVNATLVLSLLCVHAEAQHARAQESGNLDSDATFGESGEVPCPPGFPAIYTDAVFGTFRGYSNLTMVQEDQYHTYKFYTYQFSGKTSDGATGVKGTHHVNAIQCVHAAYSYWTNSSAVIGLLHNAQFTSLACGGGRFGGGEPVTSISFSCEDSDADGPGGPGDGGSTLKCYTLQVDHYWYHPDTGEVEYRYSELYSWCEEQT